MDYIGACSHFAIRRQGAAGELIGPCIQSITWEEARANRFGRIGKGSGLLVDFSDGASHDEMPSARASLSEGLTKDRGTVGVNKNLSSPLI